MFGGTCEFGPDQDRKGHGFSLLAFDFERETLVMRALFQIAQERLPPAFAPLDAQLRFSDITRKGIHIVEERNARGRWRVIVTVSLRRPPKFSTKFEEGTRPANGERVYRRRATVMDFAMCSVVSGNASSLVDIVA